MNNMADQSCHKCKVNLHFGLALLPKPLGFFRTRGNPFPYELKLAKVKKCPKCGYSMFDKDCEVLWYEPGINRQYNNYKDQQ